MIDSRARTAYRCGWLAVSRGALGQYLVVEEARYPLFIGVFGAVVVDVTLILDLADHRAAALNR